MQQSRKFPVPLFDVGTSCLSIRGSFVGTRKNMVEAHAFAVNGTVKADIESQPLFAINRILDRLEQGDVPSASCDRFQELNRH